MTKQVEECQDCIAAEHGICADCCDHEETDCGHCIACGMDCTEDMMARAYDRAKDRD